MRIGLASLSTLPEVCPGDKLGELIEQAARREGIAVGATTVMVVAQKVVSKSEGAVVRLSDIQPSALATAWAAAWGKDARVVELALQQARRVVRMSHGRLITETHHGFIVANSGVDLSNSSSSDHATILPIDPDLSAERLREHLGCGAVIISDTFGRPWRKGVVNVAIGVSGLKARTNGSATTDRSGRLAHSLSAVADELAAAAGLLMNKASGTPVVLIEGVAWTPDVGSARDLVRLSESELFS